MQLSHINFHIHIEDICVCFCQIFTKCFRGNQILLPLEYLTSIQLRTQYFTHPVQHFDRPSNQGGGEPREVGFSEGLIHNSQPEFDKEMQGCPPALKYTNQLVWLFFLTNNSWHSIGYVLLVVPLREDRQVTEDMLRLHSNKYYQFFFYMTVWLIP